MKDDTKKTILLVDDQLDLLEIMKEDLLLQNYNVETATNGHEALKLIEEKGIPDLILLDMNMPFMDGWTFSQAFGDRYGRTCPIVIMTAFDDSRTRAMEIGADSYLGKPFDLDTLHKTVESMVGS